MAETLFTIGAEVSCTDGECGSVASVVVDPVARAVTHLMVEPTHRAGLGRLVPLTLVDAGSDSVRLHCTLAEFDDLPVAEETHFLPGSTGQAGYGPGEVLSLPYYGLGGMFGGMGLGAGNLVPPVVSDLVPRGEVPIHRGDPVQATDGAIGRVQGLVIDPTSGQVSHVLLQEGHLWGKKEVVIPMSSVTLTADGIVLTMTRDEVADLPPVDVEHPTA